MFSGVKIKGDLHLEYFPSKYSFTAFVTKQKNKHIYTPLYLSYKNMFCKFWRLFWFDFDRPVVKTFGVKRKVFGFDKLFKWKCREIISVTWFDLGSNIGCFESKVVEIYLNDPTRNILSLSRQGVIEIILLFFFNLVICERAWISLTGYTAWILRMIMFSTFNKSFQLDSCRD